jgi:hypothetical protein
MQIKIKPVSFTAWKFAWFCASSGSPKKFPFCSWQFGIQIYRSNCAREYVVCFGRWRFGPTWCRTEIDTIKPNMALVRGDDGYWRPAKKTDRVMGVAISEMDMSNGTVWVDLYAKPGKESKV